MTDLGAPDLHFWLARSVGRSIGLSFSDAMEDGRLSPEGYSALVTACRRCKQTQRCQHWLGTEGGQGRAERAPEFCTIGRALAALKPH